jgi:hypothetical protein
MKHVTSDSGLLDVLLEQGHDFFTGVPDSAVKQCIGELHRLPAEQHVPGDMGGRGGGDRGRRVPGGPKIALGPSYFLDPDHELTHEC